LIPAACLVPDGCCFGHSGTLTAELTVFDDSRTLTGIVVPINAAQQIGRKSNKQYSSIISG
jgi:hypothetical protein